MLLPCLELLLSNWTRTKPVDSDLDQAEQYLYETLFYLLLTHRPNILAIFKKHTQTKNSSGNFKHKIP